MSDIHTVGVVGAGVMGTGLAQALAQTGHRVLLVDRTKEILAAAERTIAQGLRFGRVLGAKGPKRTGGPSSGGSASPPTTRASTRPTS